MFGWTPELGQGHKEGDLGHLHQTKDDCHCFHISAIYLFALPQAQVLDTKLENWWSNQTVQGSSFFQRILSQEWNSSLYWWKVLDKKARLFNRRRILQASQKSTEILRNDKAQHNHCLLHPLGKLSFPPYVQLPRQHRSWQCVLHHPHPLRCLWPLHCGLYFPNIAMEV